jgi:hypothetical protein
MAHLETKPEFVNWPDNGLLDRVADIADQTFWVWNRLESADLLNVGQVAREAAIWLEHSALVLDAIADELDD